MPRENVCADDAREIKLQIACTTDQLDLLLAEVGMLDLPGRLTDRIDMLAHSLKIAERYCDQL